MPYVDKTIATPPEKHVSESVVGTSVGAVASGASAGLAIGAAMGIAGGPGGMAIGAGIGSVVGALAAEGAVEVINSSEAELSHQNKALFKKTTSVYYQSKDGSYNTYTPVHDNDHVLEDIRYEEHIFTEITAEALRKFSKK